MRSGLRVQEALSLGERDLDARRGSLLVRSGKGGRRREIGMDAWGWEQLRPWLDARVELPVGPLFGIIDKPTRGRSWSTAGVRVEFRRLAAEARVDAALVHRRQWEGAQSREHQPARSDWPSARSRRTPARASAKRVASRADIVDVVTRSAG